MCIEQRGEHTSRDMYSSSHLIFYSLKTVVKRNCVIDACRHRCKKVFLRFFILDTFFNVFNVFFPNVFYLKNVGKVQSGKQINKKHFQNNSNEIDL